MQTDLEQHIESTPLIDTHEHLHKEAKYVHNGPDVLADLFGMYIGDELLVAGAPFENVVRLLDSHDPDIEARWMGVAAAWQLCRHTGYGAAVRNMARLVYDMAEINLETIVGAAPRNREIRRPATVGEIAAVAGAEVDAVIPVIEAFRKRGRSFLLPAQGVPLNGESLLDISHESLIRNWERLKEWVAGEAQSAATYRRLAETADLHTRGQENLLRDPALQFALDWRAEYRPTGHTSPCRQPIHRRKNRVHRTPDGFFFLLHRRKPPSILGPISLYRNFLAVLGNVLWIQDVEFFPPLRIRLVSSIEVVPLYIFLSR